MFFHSIVFPHSPFFFPSLRIFSALPKIDKTCKNALLLFVACIATCIVCAQGQVEKHINRQSVPKAYRAFWNGNERWAGAAWWANPLWDWKRDGKGSIQVPLSADRSLSLLPFEFDKIGKMFTIRFTLKFSFKGKNAPSGAAAGVAIGRKGVLDDYRSAAVYPTTQLSALVRSNGKLSLGTSFSKTSMSLQKGPIILELQGQKTNNYIKLTFKAHQKKNLVSVVKKVPISQIDGLIALISEGSGRQANDPFLGTASFQNFYLQANLYKRKNGRNLGPVMWTQYTISDNVLRLQAQLAPLNKPVFTRLVVNQFPKKTFFRNATALSHPLSRTSSFTIPNWSSDRVQKYVVWVYVLGRRYKYQGIIRKQPSKSQALKIAAFSCDQGYLFPQNVMVAQVKRQNPDLVYFAGDQIYSATGGLFRIGNAPLEITMLDFLRRWYMFGWVWGSILRDRPSIIIPDDHDVFQGNLWGNGGRARHGPSDPYGGYIMPKLWVTAVEMCHIGHLPPSPHKYSTPMGLKPYYTSLKYGGLGMAVLEDRKFKTPPMAFSKSKRNAAVGGDLLGARQETFLRNWAKDWSQTSMKIAFSQTIFSNVATHQGDFLKYTSYSQDSGAWPPEARDRVVQILSDSNVLSIHGDQHLGILATCGVDNYDDGNVAFMVPGTANGFPRAWWPGSKATPGPGPKDFTGKFIENAGNPITVHAVANPAVNSCLLDPWKLYGSSRVKAGKLKGSGYGLVTLNLRTKTATFHMYRAGNLNELFEGFPKTLKIGGK